MKLLSLLLALTSFAPCVTHPQRYRHRSEAEIARMTPAQRVDEYAEEQAHHKYDVLDEHSELIWKYIQRDGLAALPRMIEIMDEYDPTRASGRRGHKGERFDAMWMLLGDLDNHVARLRGSEEGRRAMAALERAIQRMRAAGYGQPDQHEWEQHGRFDLAAATLEQSRGINLITDLAIRNALRLGHRVEMSDEELLAFSNFLVARDPIYPRWSEMDYVSDPTRLNTTGVPVRMHTMRNPHRYYEAYLEFSRRQP